MSEYTVRLRFDAKDSVASSKDLEKSLRALTDAGVKWEAVSERGSKATKRREQAERSALRAFENVRASLSKTENAQIKYERALRAVENAEKRGIATTEQANKVRAQVAQRLRDEQKAASDTAKGLGGLGNAVDLVAKSYLALKAIDMGRAAVSTGLAWERQNKALTTAAGGAAEAGEELSFVKAEADRLGLSLDGLVGQYAKFLASSKSLKREDQRELFLGVAEAGTALALSADQMNGAMNAFEQMAAKGTVQAEELRGQLGERIPGAFDLAAKAMGVTTAELNKMLEGGEVVASDFLPKMARELRNTFGADAQANVDSLTAKINRWENAVLQAQVAFSEGFSGSFSAALGDASEGIDKAENSARSLGEALGWLLARGNDAASGIAKLGSMAGEFYATDWGGEEASGSIDRVTTAIDQVEAHMRPAREAWRILTEEMAKAQAAGDDLAQRSIRQQIARLQELAAATGKAVPGLTNFSQAQRKAKEESDWQDGVNKALSEYLAKLPPATSAAGNLTDEQIAAAKAAKELAEKIREQTAEQKALADALTISREEYDLLVAAQGLGINITDGLSEAERELTEAYAEQKKALDDLLGAEEKAQAKRLKEVSAIQERSEAYASAAAYMSDYAAAVLAAVGSMGDLDRTTGQVVDIDPEKYKKVSDAAKQMAADMKKSNDEAKRAADAWQAQLDGLADGLGAAIGDAFAEMLYTGEVNFGQLLENMLSMFVEFLADQLALWVANQIKMAAVANTTSAVSGAAGGGGGGVSAGQVAGAAQMSGASAATLGIIGVFAAAAYAWYNDRQHDYRRIETAIRDIEDVFGALSDTLGKYLPVFAAQVEVRKDGDRYRSRVGFDDGSAGYAYFDEYADAIAAATLSGMREAFQRTDAGAPYAQLGEQARNVIAGITDEIIAMGQGGVAWLEEGLAIARQLDELGMSDMEKTLSELRRQYEENIRKGAEYGLSLQKIGDLYRSQLADVEASLRSRIAQYLPGYDPIGDEFDQIRADNNALRAEYERQRQELQAHIDQILKTIAALEGGAGMGGSGGGLGQEFNRIFEGLRELMNFNESGLGLDGGGFGAIVQEWITELDLMGEAIGNSNISPDAAARLQQQRELLQELLTQMGLLGQGLSDEEIARAEREARRRQNRGSGANRAQEIEQFNASMLSIIESTMPDGVRQWRELQRWLATSTETAARLGQSLDQVNEAYEIQRQRIIDSVQDQIDALIPETWSDRIAEQQEQWEEWAQIIKEAGGSLERVTRAQREQNAANRREFTSNLAGFGAIPLFATIDAFSQLHRMLSTLEEDALALGFTLEDVDRWIGEIGASMTQNILSGISQYIEDEEILNGMRMAQHALDIANARMQLAYATQLGILAAEQIALIEAAIADAEDWTPGSGGGGDWESPHPGMEWNGQAWVPIGSGSGGSTGPSLLEQWQDFLDQWQDSGLDPLQRELNEINAEFAEAMEQFGHIPQWAAELSQLHQQVLADFWEDALSPIQEFVDSLNLSSYSPLTAEQRVEAASGEFNSLLQRLQAGDLSVLGELANAANQYLAEAAGAYGTATDPYLAIFAQVQAIMQQIAASGGNFGGIGIGVPSMPGGGGGIGLGSGAGGGADVPLVPTTNPIRFETGQLESLQRQQVTAQAQTNATLSAILMALQSQGSALSISAAAQDRIARASLTSTRSR